MSTGLADFLCILILGGVCGQAVYAICTRLYPSESEKNGSDHIVVEGGGGGASLDHYYEKRGFGGGGGGGHHGIKMNVGSGCGGGSGGPRPGTPNTGDGLGKCGGGEGGKLFTKSVNLDDRNSENCSGPGVPEGTFKFYFGPDKKSKKKKKSTKKRRKPRSRK